MAFAIVHFTVGFVTVLAVASALPLTRYRLTAAYLGGIWALVPDLHQIVDGALGVRLEAFHRSPQSDVFFMHNTMDGSVFRAHNVELTFLSLLALGVAFGAYDWAFGREHWSVRLYGGPDETDETS